MEKLKVLLIEDEKTAREQLGKFIAKEGFEVLEAGDGRTGLETFNRENPDIVITDIKMKGVEGMEVLHTVKYQNPQTEVIIITAFGGIDVSIKAIREGALDYLKKPIDLDILLVALGRAKEKIYNYRKSQPYPNILLVEDDGTTREHLVKVLEKEKLSVYQAKDGEDAMRVFENIKIDIVLMDIKMPKKTGLETLHEMRAITDDFEAIMITGYGDESNAIQAMRDGAMNFLRKPLDIDQLLVSIEKATLKLNTERALKFRVRDLELAKELITRITVDNNISIDFPKSDDTSAIDFANSLLSKLPFGIVAVDRDLKILYSNILLQGTKIKPESIDDKFVANLAALGIKDLAVESLSNMVKDAFNMPVGQLKNINTGTYSYINLLAPVIINDKKKEKIVVIMIRGERK
ncbi:MAG: response regulator [Elusimicrobia bacterium]|nr:response regulator [Candidatus Liberimonas magnetica]